VSTRLRVDNLAARAGVSVDTIRYYQARGLLPPPAREGRVAWYGDEHIARLRRIRELADQGLTLKTIGRLLRGELDEADAALAGAVSQATEDEEEHFDLDELSRRTGVPAALLQAIAKEGLLVPRRHDGEEWYTPADVEVAAAGLRLLGRGLPLPGLLDLARRHDEAMREVAERAVNLFDDHIRKPLQDDGAPPEALVDAFNDLLPATVAIVTHHFRRTLLAVALEHIERVGGGDELAVIRLESRRLGA
jgi:DNA-binding transcriptional MerR regulator